MGCGDWGGDLGEALVTGHGRDAVSCAFVNDVGGAVWPLFMVGAVLLAILIFTRSIQPVFLVMIVLGPLMVATLPPSASAAVNVLAMVAIPVVAYKFYSRITTMN